MTKYYKIILAEVSDTGRHIAGVQKEFGIIGEENGLGSAVGKQLQILGEKMYREIEQLKDEADRKTNEIIDMERGN